jgi:hypothetical protein
LDRLLEDLTAGRPEQLPALARELIRAQVDLSPTLLARAARVIE